ncbi:MAG: hypothetical protein EOM50_20645 [Erysipelotrichia bacterium]|nr:hypothetical protein [Erysipelotrichia bacterium]NCC54291.1 hypothetical protein [Erysipelotrichia bacterium]
MNYAIIYDSKSGNTKLLVDAIKTTLENKANCVYCGSAAEFDPSICEFVFLGSWCDKGALSDAILPYTNKLSHKAIGLFGTCGFGGSQKYFDDVAKRMIAQLPKDASILSSFICQGKMPVGIRKRYEGMLQDEKSKQQAQTFIENFDQALSHPDDDDIRKVIAFAKVCMAKVSNDEK